MCMILQCMQQTQYFQVVLEDQRLFVISPDDEEMMNAKTGNWFMDNPQRGRSNNSAVIVRNESTPEEFNKLMQSVREFGEPGFVLLTQKNIQLIHVLRLECIHRWMESQVGKDVT